MYCVTDPANSAVRISGWGILGEFELALVDFQRLDPGLRGSMKSRDRKKPVSPRPIRFARLWKDSIGRNRSPVYVDCFNPGRRNDDSRPLEDKIANAVELINLVLSSRIMRGLAGRWNAGAVEISRRGMVGTDFERRNVGTRRFEAANREPQFIVMTNRFPGTVFEATGSRS